jgi:hypothetical protein
MISLTRSSKKPRACGIFCHPDSSWNTAYLLGDKLNRRETILHTAAIAVRQVAAYLANEENAPAIREIFLKMDVKELVEWYESAQRDISSAPAVRRRTAELLRSRRCGRPGWRVWRVPPRHQVRQARAFPEQADGGQHRVAFVATPRREQ